jgi:hypothetical protein
LGRSNEARLLYSSAQVGVVVLSGLTPIVVLFGVASPWQAVPAAVAALIAAVSGIFRWRENWTDYSSTAKQLELERLKFDTRPATEGELTDFVDRIESIRMGAVQRWGKRTSESSE